MSVFNLFKKGRKFSLYRKITDGREILDDSWSMDRTNGRLLDSESCQKVIEMGRDMGQSVCEKVPHPGFGLFYFNLACMMKPERVVVIGSYRGFAPVCFTQALAAHGKGVCYFIDPGKMDDYWHFEDTFERLNEKFDLDGRLKHIPMTTQEVMDQRIISPGVDILYIDGDHSYQGVKYDFDHFFPLLRREGFALLHDAAATGKGLTRMEVGQFIEQELRGRDDLEIILLPFDQGLALIRKL